MYFIKKTNSIIFFTHSSQCDLSIKSVWKILKRRKFHPYHICIHQSFGSNEF